MALSREQYEKIGQQCKAAIDGNLLVGSFAAELVDESYPFSKPMWDTLFKNYDDEELGRKFVKWFKQGAKETSC